MPWNVSFLVTNKALKTLSYMFCPLNKSFFHEIFIFMIIFFLIFSFYRTFTIFTTISRYSYPWIPRIFPSIPIDPPRSAVSNSFRDTSTSLALSTESLSPIADSPVSIPATRQSTRPKYPLAYLEDYHYNLNASMVPLSSGIVHPFSYSISYDNLFASHKYCALSITTSFKPKTFSSH